MTQKDPTQPIEDAMSLIASVATDSLISKNISGKDHLYFALAELTYFLDSQHSGTSARSSQPVNGEGNS